MRDLIRRVEEILRRDNSPELGDGSLWSKMFNTRFADREAERLRIEFLGHNRFQEAWIPKIKAGGYRKFELYDLENDLAQRADVADKHPIVLERLRKQLIDITASVMADGPDWHLM